MKYTARLAGVGTRPQPRRVADALVGVLLAAALSAGLLAVRSALDGGPMTASWIAGELEAHPFTYGYVALSTSLLMVILGYVLGRREEGLWTSAQTDPLTRVANRRHFDRALAEELRRARVSGMPLALLVVDLDHLKAINDRCGHAAGDAALRLLAEVISASSRSRDLAARFGGDEFAIVVPRTRAVEAWTLAERIRTGVRARWEATAAAAYRAAVPSLSVSIGIADIESARTTEPDALFLAADRALYLAKTSGRNRTVIASQLDDTVLSGAAGALARCSVVDEEEAAACDSAGGETLPTQCTLPSGAHAVCAYAAPACEVVDLSAALAAIDPRAPADGAVSEWEQSSDVRRRVDPSRAEPQARAAQRS
jgi:diguanylate cyclase (GGDEF)-like protein